MILGVDVGGTFTDAVLAVDGRLLSAKAPSTPANQSHGVLTAVRAVLQRAGARAEEVQSFAHGMTVATNALLEGVTARTALVATEGFTDLIELGRQHRPELYRLCATRPAPLVDPALRFGAPERMTPDGPLRVLDKDAARALAAELARAGDIEAVAVVLLHAYRHPEHERRIGAALAAQLPGAHVSLSHEVVGTFREYERAATTEIDAALSPLLSGYLHRLGSEARAARLPEPAIMQSNGGLIDLDAAAGHAAWTVLSGPAAGAAGAAFVARAAGEPDVLCFDMGGTSCDVCIVSGGAVQEQDAGEIAGRPIALPMVAVHTIGAGGGSIAWRDPGGALRVGPRSAGAVPGPACYGRGGHEPTVTDANLVLGYLDAQTPLAGGVRLDLPAARAALAPLARELDLSLEACAEGIVRVAGVEMARALQVLTVARGVDPRDFALLAFGGAGPLHAAHVADELGMARVLCPQASGVLAALGLVVSPRRRDVQRSVLLGGEALTDEAVAGHVTELARRAREQLGEPDARCSAVYALRYRGQSHELTVPGDTAPSLAALREGFEAAHEERYGYRDPELAVELVTIRVSATGPAPAVKLGGEPVAEARDARAGRAGEPVPAVDRPGAGERHERSTGHLTRRAVLDGREVELSVHRGPAAPPLRFDGPAVVELAHSSVIVRPGWTASAGHAGTIVLERR